MNEETPHTREQIERLELPLRIATSAIERAGRIIDELRDSQPKAVLAPTPASAEGLLGLAQEIYRFRRTRDEEFGPRVFSDPNWDILLDLFISGEQNRKLSTSAACIGSSVPATTALRHLSALAKCGLIDRKDDEDDRRTSWVTLTPTGYEKVVSVLRSWRR